MFFLGKGVLEKLGYPSLLLPLIGRRSRRMRELIGPHPHPPRFGRGHLLPLNGRR